MFEDDDDDDLQPEQEERGSRVILTVSGIPKDTDPVKLMRLIDDVSENVYEKLGQLEVGMVTQAPNDATMLMMDPQDLAEMRAMPRLESGSVELVMKAQAACGGIMAATFQLSDDAMESDWAKKPQVEKEAIWEKRRLDSERYEREAVQQLQDERTTEIRQAFDIANSWATEPDLTPMERCHGVAHDIYQLYGVDKKAFNLSDGQSYVPESMQKAYQVNAGQAYAQHYDTHLSEQIQARSIRAAKELFR